MKMQTVAVLGAGAVGSYVIWGLAGKPGIRLGVLAEGERAGAGHVVNLGHGVPPTTDPQVLTDLVAYIHEKTAN